MKRTLVTLVLASALAVAAHAQFTLASSGDVIGTAPVYGATYFSGISLEAGDVLVISHANNKNAALSTGDISATFSNAGGNLLNSVTSPTTNTTSGAWMFYSLITAATTTNITLDNASPTKTVSQSTSYYVLRPSAGYALALGGTATSVATSAAPASSGSLSFSLTAGYDEAIAFAAQGISLSTNTVIPTDWTRDLNGVSKRATFYTGAFTSGIYGGSPVSGTTYSATWGPFAGATDYALTGLVITATSTAIPEPSTYAALAGALALGAVILRRRRG